MMRHVLRYVYRNLLPLPIRKSLDLFPQLRSAAEKPQRVRTEQPAEKKILVLSPHPDDDIFGCGGTLHRCHLSGSVITSVYMTDGRKGAAAESEALVRIRREEARRAAALIGIDELVFLEHRDGQLKSTPGAVSEMTRIVLALRPDAVYLPFLLDSHPDHLATNDIFVEAAARFDGDLVCYGYEIWTPLAMPKTKAAMTAARITVMATMRMTPMTGDTASSLFKNFMFTHPSSDRYGTLVGYVRISCYIIYTCLFVHSDIEGFDHFLSAKKSCKV
jgi:LmbE family N-acetylglucosaminyl deacetylase